MCFMYLFIFFYYYLCWIVQVGAIASYHNIFFFFFGHLGAAQQTVPNIDMLSPYYDKQVSYETLQLHIYTSSTFTDQH